MRKTVGILIGIAMVAAISGCGNTSAKNKNNQEAATRAADSGTVGTEDTADAAADAEGAYTFKFALQNSENHPLCQGITKFGEILKEKTDGRMNLDIYYSGSLGDKTTTVQGMQSGTIDAAMLMSSVIADYGCKELGVFTLPYLFDSVEHARAFEKGEAGVALLDTVQSSQSAMVCIGAYQESARNYFFTKARVEKPSDMKNLLIRCQEGSIYYDAIEAMGADAQSVAFSELYSALQSGVVDGAEQPLSGFVNNAFQEVARYYVLDQHEISPNLILFSEATWNQLSTADQEIIKACLEESMAYFEELSDSMDIEYLQTIKDAGIEVIEVNVSEWQDACSSVYDTYGKEYAVVVERIRNTKY